MTNVDLLLFSLKLEILCWNFVHCFMQEWQNHDSKLNNEVYRMAWTYLRGNNGFFSYSETEEKNKCAKPSKFQWVISWKQKINWWYLLWSTKQMRQKISFVSLNGCRITINRRINSFATVGAPFLRFLYKINANWVRPS